MPVFVSSFPTNGLRFTLNQTLPSLSPATSWMLTRAYGSSYSVMIARVLIPFGRGNGSIIGYSESGLRMRPSQSAIIFAEGRNSPGLAPLCWVSTRCE